MEALSVFMEREVSFAKSGMHSVFGYFGSPKDAKKGIIKSDY